MKETILTALLFALIPVVWGLGVTGAMALLGVWRRANAAAKLGALQQASAIMETAVETAIHSLDSDNRPLIAKVQDHSMTLTAFGAAVLLDLRKQGTDVLGPALAEALGATVAQLERVAVAKAMAKTGMTLAQPPPH